MQIHKIKVQFHSQNTYVTHLLIIRMFDFNIKRYIWNILVNRNIYFNETTNNSTVKT